MQRLDRRAFLSRLTGSLVTASGLSWSKLALPASAQQAQQQPPYPYDGANPTKKSDGKACWLDVAAPFMVQDDALGLNTEMLLTATCFPGIEGYRAKESGTDYELLLFDGNGKPVDTGGAGRVNCSPMRPTVLRLNEVLGHKKNFWGSARLRLAPHGPGVVTRGSSSVNINHLPACRAGDKVFEATGGADPIAKGCETVNIGG